MSTKLYHHKTSGGAEYLMDTFIPWKHNGKSGKEGTVNEKTSVLIRLDGKTPELIRADAAPELLEIVNKLASTNSNDFKSESEHWEFIAMLRIEARAAIAKATS